MRSLALGPVLALLFVLSLSSVTGCARAGDAAPPKSPEGNATVAATTPSPVMAERAPRPAEAQDESRVAGISTMSKDSPGGAPPAPPPPPPQGQPPQHQSPAVAAPQARDFVIYTADFVMAVYQVETGLAAIERVARERGGYLAVKKDREITIRVPRNQFDAALSSIDKIGDVLHRDVSAVDVTDEHVDLEIRIKNARAMQQQLTALLAKANVKEALEIEKELGRVTEELERLEGKLKLLNDKIAFSTITVHFEARGQTLQTQRVALPFPWLGSLGLPGLLRLDEVK